MRVELRADGVTISGYVNVTGRENGKPVMTARGKVNEAIEPGAFQRAIERNEIGITALLDHDPSHRLAGTADGTLRAYEDNIGLYAELKTSDPDVMEAAKQKKLRGWSFNMRNIVDEIEERADKLPLRHVKEFDMDEISLILRKVPVYSATSVEVRAEAEEDVETRGTVEDVELDGAPEEKPEEKPNRPFEERLQKLKK